MIQNNMRELKFRIWDKIGEVFRGNLYKYLINAHTGELEVWVFSDLYDEWYNTYDDKDLIVQQYTGLQDKNGKDIYEGDVVSGKYCHSSDVKIVVRYYDGAFNISSEYWQKDSLIVLGNIFENPELIQ